jgi:hypothetical protein
MKLRTIALLLVLSSFLSGCGLFGGDEERDEFAGLTNEEQFYRRAQRIRGSSRAFRSGALLSNRR